MNSVTYLSVAGITPAAPLVLEISFAKEGTHGAVTTLPPDAFTSFTAIAIQLRYSIPGKTGVLRNGTGCMA
jgi:hypothetical protein